jgi:hypothetical protein
MVWLKRTALAAVAMLLIALSWTVGPAQAQEAKPDAAKELRRPKIFAIIFNYGYGGDALPKDPENFEKALLAIKDANYNTVMCLAEPWRVELCKKHGMKILVDTQATGHHVYKEPDKAKEVFATFKGNDTIFGYSLWHDTGLPAAGRDRDAALIHEVDPTHPTYVGSYRLSGIGALTNQDMIGYYDFHWRRGYHWPHLFRVSQYAREKDVRFMRYCQADPGIVGVGNKNRVGYTISTSIVFGLKGYLFHNREVFDRATWTMNTLGNDLKEVNAKFTTIGPELMKIGNPSAVYSTSITLDAKNRPTTPGIPGGFQALPDTHPFAVTAGEVLFGLYKDDQGRDAVVFANHNAYQPQDVTITFKEAPKKVSFFNREKAAWEDVPVANNEAKIKVDVFAAEIVRLEK